MCTYDYLKAMATVLEIQSHPDPEAYCESLARPWNCKYSKGRIRLDNKPEERP